MSRSVEVLDVGALATVQDAGRPGHAHLGVPRSGWVDAPSAERANRLVGNAAGAAVVEGLLGGLRLRAAQALTLAVTGAPAAVRVDGRPAAFGLPLAVAAGAVLEVGVPAHGVRCYVALAGGIAVDPVLGSRSTDTLSGLGPAPLRAGDVLPLGPSYGDPAPVDHDPATRWGDPGEVVLRLLPGPRADWFEPDPGDALTGAPYVVAADSDRVGLRLVGPRLVRSREGELPSEGLVLGAVQVPASGQPVVFLADHPTTGGYPVVAVVHPDDLPACGQVRPGDTVRFQVPAPGVLRA